MAAGVTHDVNNLMMVVSASTESLLLDVESSASARQELVVIDEAITQTRAMTNRLLDFCRGRPRAAEQVVLCALVRRTMFLAKQGIPDDVEISLDLPAGDQLIVQGTPGEIEQVLMNLVRNAADAMPAGGTLTVSVADHVVHEPMAAAYSAIAPGRYAVVSVRDTGVGMTRDVQEHMFEPYFTTRRDAGSAGLGLATVLGTAHDLQGHVAVTSGPSMGSEFKVYLPLSPAAPIAAPIAAPPSGLHSAPQSALQSAREEERQQAETSRLPHRMLVVDDDVAVRRAVSRLLSRIGIQVVEVSDAEQALATLARNEASIDAVLSDIYMPGMSGVELFTQARANGFAGPVILMTGYSDLDLPDDFSRDGLGKLLTKPFSAAELQESFAACAP